jgi:hypothetical protein
VFNNGSIPKGYRSGSVQRGADGLNVGDHVNYNPHNSVITSASTNPDIWKGEGSDAKWLLHIEAPGGVDVKATYGANRLRQGESEIAFPGGVAPQRIVGAQRILHDPETHEPRTGPFIPNPRFQDLP